MTDRADRPTPEAAIAESLARLTDETRDLVRAELSRAQDEMWEKATRAAPAVGLLAVGAGLGQLRTVELPVPTGTLTRTARAAGEAIEEQADRAG